MRVFLNKDQRLLYFSAIKKKSDITWEGIADRLKVSERVLRNWRVGDYSIPLSFVEKVREIFGITLSSNIEIKKDYWNTSKAGYKGAKVRYLLYGNLGTPEGRRKGGLNSINSKKLRETNFTFLKQIKTPPLSVELAELFGILIGDGNISSYQVRVYLDKVTDEEYSQYVGKLFFRIFAIKPSIYKSQNRSTIDIVISRKLMVGFLVNNGLPLGNKIEQEIDIPEWIKSNKKYSLACLRGIFDTDGSVYFDKHKSKDGFYESINIAITSASGRLLYSMYEIMAFVGLTPTISSNRSIRVRKKEQVFEFFDKICPKNTKHIRKFNSYFSLERYPSGYKGIVSKTVGT